MAWKNSKTIISENPPIFFFANLNDFENWHKREKGGSHVIYKEDLLKKISFCRDRIDNVTNTLI